MCRQMARRAPGQFRNYAFFRGLLAQQRANTKALRYGSRLLCRVRQVAHWVPHDDRLRAFVARPRGQDGRVVRDPYGDGNAGRVDDRELLEEPLAGHHERVQRQPVQYAVWDEINEGRSLQVPHQWSEEELGETRPRFYFRMLHVVPRNFAVKAHDVVRQACPGDLDSSPSRLRLL